MEDASGRGGREADAAGWGCGVAGLLGGGGADEEASRWGGSEGGDGSAEEAPVWGASSETGAWFRRTERRRMGRMVRRTWRGLIG